MGFFAAALLAAAPAGAATFLYTGGEQTYVVPGGVSSVQISAIGAPGGTPPPGGGVSAGRGAVVTGVVAVSPGQILYVYVGGAGGFPAGGFNGGGDGGTADGIMAWGGGGASDVSRVPDSAGDASFQARVIAAGGGGGSAGIAAGGGDAGNPGGCCGALGRGSNAAQPGSQTGGGAGGGCAMLTEGCGESGGLGFGGDGGASGTAENARAGGGGGGGLYGGGGGAGHVSDIGGGAGGSSLIPPGGTFAIAPALTTPPRIDIDPYIPPPPSPRCSDGIDNDGDHVIDFPADTGCSSASDDDETNATRVIDTTPPTAALGGKRRQKLGRTIRVTLRCGNDEDCIATAHGKLSIRDAAHRYALKPARPRTVRKGTAAPLRLRLSIRARAAATRALRRRKNVRAAIQVTVTDAAGNAATLKRTIQLTR